ncbi:DUF2637 domain-containing protein [Streptomyces sp. NBC_01264]|uniref:DUF2637 domain-containing protein n=1 Tax=Streptomyces sp. NBC_01264 TaxID=2903804 RepID=UPI00224FA077|nr:DUF2637 domain-containing protein [Streptomyces sp. NBC_01264]MCX4783322.1 DUF2637 domain-containing protein [Streptomyces sp. NBC_01264]
MTRAQQVLVGVVAVGAVVIAGIGFAGSYGAVRALAAKKGFGTFALFFPIGIDAGIIVLLALDLLLSWIRIPFPLLRQTAWLLTAATIAFNGAAAWPDPLGVGMHAVIPLLFVVTVEAARHGVGRIADITADRDMDGVRFTRWLLSPVPTFKLWRRMKLWELRSYEQAVDMEQDRLIYQARLAAKYGRAWRHKAPVGALLPLRLARVGVPLADTAPAGLAAAGISIQWRPVAVAPVPDFPAELPPGFEEHAVAALEVAAWRVPVLAEDKAGRGREEVTARVSYEDPEKEGLDDCEDTGQADTGQAEEPAGEPATGPEGQGRSDDADESTLQQVASAPSGSVAPPRQDTRVSTALTFGNEMRAAYAEHEKRELSAAWSRSRTDAEPLTAADFVTKHNTTTRKLREALKAFPAPTTA